MQTLKELVDQLPLELQDEVRGYAEFLLERRSKNPGGSSDKTGPAL